MKMSFVVKYVSLMPIQIAERARPGARGDAQASILLPGVCPIRSRVPPSQVPCFMIKFWPREASRTVVGVHDQHGWWCVRMPGFEELRREWGIVHRVRPPRPRSLTARILPYKKAFIATV